MTDRQMIERAQRAEVLSRRYSEIERERAVEGDPEDALEAHRMVLEQQAAANYWRERAMGASA